MTELNNFSPFLNTHAMAGLPSMGVPATPWAARHMLTTRTSMDGVLHEEDNVAQVKRFIVGPQRQIHNGVVIAS